VKIVGDFFKSDVVLFMLHDYSKNNVTMTEKSICQKMHSYITY
jgi:hypothetical protein